MERSTDRHDCAVVWSCDLAFYPMALFMLRQIAFHNPRRRFDFIVATRDTLEVPDWARALGLTIHRSGDLPPAAEAARYRRAPSLLYRILLARELQPRYRHILYLDSDMFVEGGDLNRLLEIDLGPHPIGAVLDSPFFYKRNYHAKEFVRLGWPRAPYANTGFQVIDTRAYVEQEVERRSFDVATAHPGALVYTDQSLTNIALRGGFAQLAPCWNWQLTLRLPLLSLRYPAFIRHFIGPVKPDRDPQGRLDGRFALAYRAFLTEFMPEHPAAQEQGGGAAPVSGARAARLALDHAIALRQAEAMLRRYPDPYRALV